jgi:putative heme iron utilization protein
MVRRGLKGALATQDAETGAPYASMVLLATDVGGAPTTLISNLARHTKNLAARPAASLLIDLSNAAGDADSGGRVSLMGRLVRVGPELVKARFLARHPSAAGYADFADFGFFRFDVQSAHLIENFGRIVPLAGAAMVGPLIAAEDFERAEGGLLAALWARWPDVTGFDAEGVDLRRGEVAERLDFALPAMTPVAAAAAARELLEARAQGV